MHACIEIAAAAGSGRALRVDVRVWDDMCVVVMVLVCGGLVYGTINIAWRWRGAVLVIRLRHGVLHTEVQ